VFQVFVADHDGTASEPRGEPITSEPAASWPDGRRCFPGLGGERTDDCRRRAQQAALQSAGREPGEVKPLAKISVEAESASASCGDAVAGVGAAVP